MAVVVFLYILAAMIFYDFLLHAIETLHGDKKRAIRKIYYWPPSKVFGNGSHKFYNRFWTAYWGLAFALVIAYILV